MKKKKWWEIIAKVFGWGVENIGEPIAKEKAKEIVRKNTKKERQDDRKD